MKLYRIAMLGLLVLGLAACSTTTDLSQEPTNPDQALSDYRQELKQQATEFWQPAVGEAWHYQIGWPVSQSDQFDDNIKIYSIDVFDNDPADITFLKNKGIKVICYINVGAWEVWRDDAGQFPDSVILGNYDNWDGERWLDIRPSYKLDNPADGEKLRRIMEDRFDEAARRGCDAIEPDNLDAWNPNINLNNGQAREFEISYQDQLDYNIYLANIAHERGLSIGLKSDVEQAADLVDYYDWALNESCTITPYTADPNGISECQYYQDTFIPAGKAVFWVEYIENGKGVEDFCPQTDETVGLSFMLSDLLLRGDVTTAQRCPDTTPPNPNPTPTPTPNPNPSGSNILSNASFQNDLSSWIVGSCGAGTVSVNGQSELRLSNGEACIGQVVDAAEFVPYTFSCSAKNANSGYSEISMYIEGSGGTLLASDNLIIANDAFASQALTLNAPAGTETILVAAYTFDGDMSIDSCTLSVDGGTPLPPAPTPNPSPTPNPAGNLLTNGDFENGLTAWNASYCGGTAIIESTNAITNASMELFNYSGDACVSQGQVAEATKTYTLSCKAINFTSGYAELSMYFENSNRVSIGSVSEPIVRGSVQTYTISQVAPSGTAFVVADMYLNNADIFVDDCVLTVN